MTDPHTSTNTIKPSENTIMRTITIVILIAIVAFLLWHVWNNRQEANMAETEAIVSPTPVPTVTPIPTTTSSIDLNMANPAATNCDAKGGTNTIMTKPDGSQYGVCVFEDNMQCEDWAMLNGDCPEGGIKVTGYTSQAETYCAITGGEVSNGNCTLDGTVCSLDAYYVGSCSSN